MSTRIDYKRELESASKSMIMIHEPKLLIKLVLRMIVRKVHIKHAGMVLHDVQRDAYVLNISRGEKGVKIPEGFARFDRKSPIIKLFTDKEYRSFTLKRNAFLTQDLNKLIWQESVLTNGNGTREMLHKVGQQMQMLNSIACVPAFYQDKLMAILLLGEKKGGRYFEQDELDFFAALASDVAMAIRNAQLFEGLKREAQKNKDLFIRTTVVLGATIEAKDKYTSGHTERVTNYAMTIAKKMKEDGVPEMTDEFLESLYISGMLHDIGKIGVPEDILNKTGPLTPEEFDVMKRHTLHGEEILKPLSELRDSLDGVKYHHERYDGKGYPEGLKGEEIPLIAAIICVADTLDAMTTDRPYRKGFSKAAAVLEIKNNIGTQFHPVPAKALIELFEEGKI